MRTVRQAGFTIIETMIVLGVTGALFMLAFLAVNGKQNTTEFHQALNDIQSVIQQTISQVGAGEYGNTANFTCNGTGGSLVILAGVNNQGANTGCIFLGKAVQFGVLNTSPQKYVTYTIAGLQNNNGSLSAATPTAIAPGITTNNNAGFPNASTPDILHNGLKVVSMNSVSGAGVKTPIGAVAFISGLGTYNGSQLISGSQQISMLPIPSSNLNTTTQSAVDAINKQLVNATTPAGGVQICFQSGGTNQSGLVTVGSNGRELSVSTVIKSTTNCT